MPRYPQRLQIGATQKSQSGVRTVASSEGGLAKHQCQGVCGGAQPCLCSAHFGLSFTACFLKSNLRALSWP
eukprot:10888244-Karenia_brevis.AAC.1